MASFAMAVDADYLPLPDEDDAYREDNDTFASWLLQEFHIHSLRELLQLESNFKLGQKSHG